MTRLPRPVCICFLSLSVWLAGSGLFATHPNHSSLAEIGWNEARDTLQVALRVIPEDLEAALTFRLKTTFVLGKGDKIDRALLDYLFASFIVTTEAGDQLPMNFLGKEVGHDGAWLFFEIPTKGAAALYLENRILCDWEETQINRVIFSNGPDRKKNLRYTPATKRQRLWP